MRIYHLTFLSSIPVAIGQPFQKVKPNKTILYCEKISDKPRFFPFKFQTNSIPFISYMINDKITNHIDLPIRSLLIVKANNSITDNKSIIIPVGNKIRIFVSTNTKNFEDDLLISKDHISDSLNSILLKETRNMTDDTIKELKNDIKFVLNTNNTNIKNIKNDLKNVILDYGILNDKIVEKCVDFLFYNIETKLKQYIKSIKELTIEEIELYTTQELMLYCPDGYYSVPSEEYINDKRLKF